MSTRREYVRCVLLPLLLVPSAMALAAEPDKPAETRSLMRAKLQYSQKILEGLTVEDFDMIAKNAQELSLLSMESRYTFGKPLVQKLNGQ